MQVLLSLAAFAASVSAHGVITSPAARTPGAATEAACGKGMVNFYKADNTSYPEALIRAKGLDSGYNPAKCNLWLCKGFQAADNSANVNTYKTGDTVNINVWLRIPHAGYANVSVVDTSTNKVVGTALKAWASNYAATMNPPKDQTAFSVKIPELGTTCTTAGKCVLQWHWLGQGQTYQSCIDFVTTAPVTIPPKEKRSWIA